MPGNFKHYDLRAIKTNRALIEALPKLLTKRSFGRITVNDICEESQISRTAFYSHYNDKYDLLKRWLAQWLPDIVAIRNDYAQFELEINKVIDDNKSIITNLLEDANSETKELIDQFVQSVVIDFIGCDHAMKRPFDLVLYSFCSGGIVNLVLWQIKNKFPVDSKFMNTHFYEILDVLRKLENNKLSSGEHNE